MEKLKIRKIETSIDEIFSRIEKLLEISEKIPKKSMSYSGTFVKDICSTLGIKELEFWEIRFDNEDLFDNKFKVIYDRNPAWNKLMKYETYNQSEFY